MNMNKFRFAWHSPFSRASDVSSFTGNIIKHFNKNYSNHDFEATLFINDNGPRYASPIPVVPLSDYGSVAELMTQYDATFYNIGNNTANHGRIINTMRSFPGISILHDYSYQHVFAWLCFEYFKSKQLYSKIMHDWHGDAGFNITLSSGISTNGPTHYSPWDSEHVAQFPLLAPMAALSSAIIVHSEFSEYEAKKHFDGPVCRIFLPWDQKPFLDEHAIAQWRSSTVARDECKFVVFGHIGIPKCIDKIIQAMGSSGELQAISSLTIAGFKGDYEYCKYLENLAYQLGLTDKIKFEYNISDDRLLRIKKDADVFINLRWPNTEGASGSLTEQLNTGKPVIAYNSGCYSEIPQGAIIHVERDLGIGSIAKSMLLLASNANLRLSVGSAALSWVRSRGGEVYVEKMKQFALDIQPELKNRKKFISPGRLADPTANFGFEKNVKEHKWLVNLLKARKTFYEMEIDPKINSPEPFLDWTPVVLARFFCQTLLEIPQSQTSIKRLEKIIEELGVSQRINLFKELSLIRHILNNSIPSAEVANYTRVNRPLFWRLAEVFDDESRIRLIYAAVLCRRAENDELLYWSRSLKKSNFYLLIQNFIESEEYSYRFGDNYMRTLIIWIDSISYCKYLIGNKSDAPILKAGMSLRFDINHKYNDVFLRGKWHEFEEYGVWAGSISPRLCLRLDDSINNALLYIDMIPNIETDQVVEVSFFDGIENVLNVELSSRQVHQCAVPISSRNADQYGFSNVNIAIEKSALLGNIEDNERKRFLSIMLTDIKLIDNSNQSDPIDSSV
jgi:glycosyltransferase involved in cell wall biosynthesis